MLGDLIEDGRIRPVDEAVPLLKNVCARVWPQVADELDVVVEALGVTKRRFVEAAFVDAIERARQIMAEEGWTDVDEAISHSVPLYVEEGQGA
jgi:hypothetical protein